MGAKVEAVTLLFAARFCVAGHHSSVQGATYRPYIRVNSTYILYAQVACETATKTGMVMVFGEITTKAKVNYEEIVRETCKGIGFVSEDVGLDADNCKVGYDAERQQ